MLHKVTELNGFKISADDGELGEVEQLYFDDHAWTVRYFVVDTGKWLPGRQVLISPASVGRPNWSRRRLPVLLTQEQIRRAPGVETELPVARQEEIALQQYYGWPAYWSMGTYYVPGAIPQSAAAGAAREPVLTQGDPNLRSTKEVIGYRIRSSDDEIGHVQDFLVDDESWDIRYLVIDTRNWLPGKKVLVSPQWVEGVSWAERRVHLDVSAGAIRNSPEYRPDEPVTREYEKMLHDYYQRPAYW